MSIRNILMFWSVIVAAAACSGSDGATTCPAGQELCDSVCVDVQTDWLHCGACGASCASGEVCDGAGACTLSCQSGLTDCSATCVDLQSDRANCGTCDSACQDGEVCDGAGSCTLSCQSGLTDCSGACVDVQGDRLNCGACEAACQDGEVCDGAGSCALSCQSGLADCAGTCVDVESDRDNCGACGNACVFGEVCNGDCLAAPIVTAVSPGRGPTTGVIEVTITGDNFDTVNGVGVMVGGLAATVNSVTATEVRFDLPTNLGNPGLVTVMVVDQFGRQAAAADPFLYYYGMVSFALQATDYASAVTPRGLELADFNGDDILDMATTSQGDFTLLVRMGVGDGTFGDAVVYPVTQRPEAMGAVDLNGDTYPDLVVNTRSSTADVNVFINNQDGTFAAAAEYGAGQQQRTAVRFGDFDGDNHLDLAVGGRGAAYVKYGTGDGGFTGGRNVATARPKSPTFAEPSSVKKMLAALGRGGSVPGRA